MKIKKMTKLLLTCALFISTIDVQFNASEVEATSENKVAETTEVVYAPTNPTAAQVEAAAATDLVVFEDSNLEAAIASELGVAVGEITVGDMEGISVLYFDGYQISDISGLEYATNLSTLHLGANQISDLSPLSGLTNLNELGLGYNQISDITPLAGLTELTWLGLDTNQISDLSPLSGLTELTWLNLYETQISDISPLAGLTKLTYLNLQNNQISDISPLAGLTKLTYLNLRSNQVSDISSLSGLTELTDLDLYKNQISDISPLSGLTSLTELYLTYNQISDISPLSGLTNLTNLWLDYNQISDISPLSGLTSLTELRLSSNQISDISPLSGLTSLTQLYLYSNQISDISPLSGLTNLNALRLTSNQISDISPLSGLTNLSELYIDYNQISDITPLAGLTSLRDLHLSKNQISDISPLANLTNLNYLSLNDQSISLDDLTVSANDEIFFTVTGIDGTEYPVSLGVPSIGTQDMNGTWDIPTSIGSVVDKEYSGTVSQTVTYTVAPLTGSDSASVSEETVLSDEKLISLFKVVSNTDEIITVNQSAVDYSTPGEYQVVFTDESGNEFISTLTVEDKLPTLEVNKSKVSISVDSSIEDVLDQLEYSATEITTGDLNSVISIDDSSVDYSTPGNYEIIFTVADEEGNTVTKKVTVTILEESIVDTENNENNGNAATDNETENSKSENVKSEQTETNEDNQLAMTGSESIVLFLISSLIIFIVLKFNLKKL